MDTGSVARIFRRQAEALEAQAYARFTEALDACAKELLTTRPDPRVFITLARRLDRGDAPIALAEHERSLALLREACSRCDPSVDVFSRAIHAHRIANRTSAAIALAAEGGERFPGSARFRAFELLTLPCFYADDADIHVARSRFEHGLASWEQGLDLDTDQGRRQALDAVGHHVNFYLPAQGENDITLQRAYGNAVHRVMHACFPHWTRPLSAPAPASGGRIRVGFVSAHFHQHSVYKTHSAWIRRRDRQRFDVHAYSVGTIDDVATESVRSSSHRFVQATEVVAMAKAIASDHLDALVYLDVGMRPIVTMLASLRLAPVQAATWGHPETSGLPTIDTFLSSELMEPDDADTHYSERLVRLPGIGICFEQPRIPPGVFWHTRADFGLHDDAVVYLCCQSLHKYLPSYDRLLAAIAARVPAAQFVFLVPNPIAGDDLRRRLQASFASHDRDADRHCVLLPPQSPISYWNVNRLADVFLDSTEWSGCNSTLEAIASDLPVVTTAGQFMRGRHSSAILTQLGVTDTLAADTSAYVDIAVRLADDATWRRGIVGRVKARSSALFGDTRSVSALEEWIGSAQTRVRRGGS